MINWAEYKKFKIIADRCISTDVSVSDDIEIELLKLKLNKQTKEQTTENIINFLSCGEHYKDNPFYDIRKIHKTSCKSKR